LANESKFDLSRGAERIFEKFVVVPTGIEPESAKNADDAEEPDVIDISKLKKIGE
jgi:hypothetical protein